MSRDLPLLRPGSVFRYFMFVPDPLKLIGSVNIGTMESTKRNSQFYAAICPPGLSLTILHIGSDTDDFARVREILGSSGIAFRAKQVNTTGEAIKECNSNRCDVILLDMALPEGGGLDALKSLCAMPACPPIIIMTGTETEEEALEALREGADDYILKPEMSAGYLLRSVKHVIDRRLIRDLLYKHLEPEAILKSEKSDEATTDNRDRFLKKIAHDLKNPFTVLLGSTELLAGNISRMSPEKIMDLLQIMNDAARSGYLMLQNLLDWTMLKTGSVIIKPSPVDLKRIIDENLSLLCGPGHMDGLNITVHVDSCRKVSSDKKILSSILRNMMANALKFTMKPGSIMVSCEIGERMEIISVSYSASVMGDEKNVGPLPMEQEQPGSGEISEKTSEPGLLLSREFASMLGGKISEENKPDGGRVLTFTIPSHESSE